MKLLAWLAAPTLLYLLGIPLGTALLVAAIAVPGSGTGSGNASSGIVTGGTSTIACSKLSPGTGVSAPVVEALPSPGPQRRASLTNPPPPIPPRVLTLYQQAAAAYGLPWPLLAGIGMEETNHGRNNTTSSAGAQGLMQFIPATFAAYGVDGNHDGRVDITNDADSIFSAAHYLAAMGARTGDGGVRQAIFGYNHATWYVNDVLTYAQHYATQACSRPPGAPPPHG